MSPGPRQRGALEARARRRLDRHEPGLVHDAAPDVAGPDGLRHAALAREVLAEGEDVAPIVEQQGVALAAGDVDDPGRPRRLLFVVRAWQPGRRYVFVVISIITMMIITSYYYYYYYYHHDH